MKNNLQTISSLLRLQAPPADEPARRRPRSPESVRRIRTIALVHETLSREPGDDVAFIEIVRPLLRLAEEGLQSPDRPVQLHASHGDGGRMPGHASPRRCRWCSPSCCRTPSTTGSPRAARGGEVVVQLANDGERAVDVRVIDDGARRSTRRSTSTRRPGLGLSIVRTLVTTELNGTISMRSATPDDLEAGRASARARRDVTAP